MSLVIGELHVSEGEGVEEGDELMTLDLTKSRNELLEKKRQ